MARVMEDDVDDSHTRMGRVATTDSHTRRMAEQAQAPHNIRSKGARAHGRVIDPTDEPDVPVFENVKTTTREMQGQYDNMTYRWWLTQRCLVILRQRP